MKVKEVIAEYNRDKLKVENLASIGKPYEGKNPLLKQLWKIKKEEFDFTKKEEEINDVKTKLEDKANKLKDSETKLKDLNSEFKSMQGELNKNINNKDFKGIKTWNEFKK